MPNGDCPIGARIQAENASQARDLQKLEVRMTIVEKALEVLIVTSAVQAWKIGVIIGLIVLVLGSVGDTILSPIMAAMINGGG